MSLGDPPAIATPILRLHSDRLAAVAMAVGIGLSVLFVLGDLVLNFANPAGLTQVRRTFNLGREDSLAATAGVVLTLLAALSAWCGYAARRALRSADRSRWLVLAGFLSYVGVDDAAGLHERVGPALRDLAESGGSAAADLFARFPSYSWQVVYVPALAALTLYAAATLARDASGRTRLLVVVAVLCLAFAVLLDFFEGLDAHHAWNPYAAIARRWDLRGVTIPWFREAPYDAIAHLSKVIEETLETVGMTLLWAAVLLRMAPGGLAVELDVPATPGAKPAR